MPDGLESEGKWDVRYPGMVRVLLVVAVLGGRNTSGGLCCRECGGTTVAPWPGSDEAYACDRTRRWKDRETDGTVTGDRAAETSGKGG